MVNLTFGEQVKIVLSRKGMTIKELAELIEERTGKKMSRQNLTQRLGRDNFQEQDMREIAEILGCPFQLSILAADESMEKAGQTVGMEPTERELQKLAKKKKAAAAEEKVSTAEKAAVAEHVPEVEEIPAREVTIGDLVDFTEAKEEKPVPEVMPERTVMPKEEKRKTSMSNVFKGFKKAVNKNSAEEQEPDVKKEPQVGEINPYTRREYETNSVRMHPKRIGYVQVYDRAEHKWTDMTEWAFLGYQERKKKLLGKDYVPPIYLD